MEFLSIYPTLCDLAGIPIPGHVQGPSIKPLLADPASAWDRTALCTHGYMNHAVRSEQWRYIRYADGSEELYDHGDDPYEREDLAGKPNRADRKAKLARGLPRKDAPAPGKAAGKRKKKRS